MKNIPFSNTRITGGLWKQKQDMVRKVSAKAVYDRFCETGRFDAFKFDWKEGMPNKPHLFWDSDVAKWIEGVAYITQIKREPKLEKIADETIDLIEMNQGEDGYFNIFFTVINPEARYQNRDWHELYCAGHLMEAAVAYYRATGKRKLLDCMEKYAAYIEKRFIIDRDTAFRSSGHEEIELALVKMYECTGNKKYLDMSEYFINIRGTEEDYIPYPGVDIWHRQVQAHKPVREQDEAVGHAVRATYLYRGMSDLAYHTKDQSLIDACRRLFENIVNKRMFITGGIGSISSGEAFSTDYDLSNILAYTETCAAIGLALFAASMQKLEINSVYADVVERILYNGFLSGVSLSGDEFFYQNPLETVPRFTFRDKYSPYKSRSAAFPKITRSRVFACSCCPPNVVRFIPSIGDLIYGVDGDTLYVHQFMQSESDIELNGKALHITQKTSYPDNGKIAITVTGGDAKIAVRIPGWYDGYKGATTNGYAYFDVKDGETVSLDFAMRVKLMEARPELTFDCNRFAVMRGPVVFCMESGDNGDNIRDIRLSLKGRYRYGRHPELRVPMLTVKAYRRKADPDAPIYYERTENLEQFEAKLIPYYAFANRGAAEMQIWSYVK